MARRKRSLLMQRRARFGYLFILPLMVGVVCFFLPALIQTFRFSVYDMELVSGGYELSPVGWEYYRYALQGDPQFLPLLGTTLKTFGLQVPVVVIFSLVIANMLNMEFHGRGIARVVFFIPVILSTGIIAQIENSTGFIDLVENNRTLVTGSETAGMEISQLLTSINFSDTLIDIVESAIANIYSIVQSSGMQIFILLAALREIPGSLYEAAAVEGCNKWELFWKITIPMISPQIVICTVYTIIDQFASVDNALFTYVHSLAFSSNQFGLANAMYVIYLLCLAVLVAIIMFVLLRFVRAKDR